MMTNTNREPKLPTALHLGDTVHIYGRTLTVTHVDDPRGRIVVADGEREYYRHTYFVEHRNLWRSRWIRVEAGR